MDSWTRCLRLPGGIDRDILRIIGRGTFENSLQTAEIIVILSKAEIIDIKDKLQRAVVQLFDDFRYFQKLMLIEFDKPNTPSRRTRWRML